MHTDFGQHDVAQPAPRVHHFVVQDTFQILSNDFGDDTIKYSWQTVILSNNFGNSNRTILVLLLPLGNLTYRAQTCRL